VGLSRLPAQAVVAVVAVVAAVVVVVAVVVGPTGQVYCPLK
jgi:hypothetical protein